MLEDKSSTFRLATYKLVTNFFSKMELICDGLFSVKDVKNGSKNFASLLVGVPIGDEISRKFALSEKCPNTELFLVRIFPHSD